MSTISNIIPVDKQVYVFEPIHGLDEDILLFIKDFCQKGSPRFTAFSELWKEHMFIHVIYGRFNQHLLYDILGCIFFRLVDRLQKNLDLTKLEQICIIYLLYAFHGKQPLQNHVQIRVTISSWEQLTHIAREMLDDGHLDVYYIFRRLCVDNAFAFCATLQPLFPSANLFNSPCKYKNNTTINTVDVKAGGGVDSLAVISAVTDDISLAVQHYAIMKRKLKLPFSNVGVDNNPQKRTKMINVNNNKTDNRDDTDNDDESDDDLLGLNLVTYPGSLRKLLGIKDSIKKEMNEYFEETTDESQQKTLVNSGASKKFADDNDISVIARAKHGHSKTESLLPSSSNCDVPTTSRGKSVIQGDEVAFEGDGEEKSDSRQEVESIGLRRQRLRHGTTWSANKLRQSAQWMRSSLLDDRPTLLSVVKRASNTDAVAAATATNTIIEGRSKRTSLPVKKAWRAAKNQPVVDAQRRVASKEN